jgi:hypothetical protein
VEWSKSVVMLVVWLWVDLLVGGGMELDEQEVYFHTTYT